MSDLPAFAPPPYRGQAQCALCPASAKFKVGVSPRCGRHSRLGNRVDLPKDPMAAARKEAAQDAHDRTVEEARQANVAAGRPGRVTCTGNNNKGMAFVAQRVDGYRTVLPNHKHGNSKQGVGLARLSPKSLGPVPWDQPYTPQMLNIENMHQGSKVWLFEIDSEQADPEDFLYNVLRELIKPGASAPDADLDLTAEIRKALETTPRRLVKLSPIERDTRKHVLGDATPHRHKYTKAEIVAKGGASRNERPVFSMFYVRVAGTVEQLFLTYVQSRYIYCHWMEELVVKEPQWQQLVDMRAQGYNINIAGYDGYTSAATPWKQYLDASRPFGHEKVLETMLTVPDPADYPWNRFRREHAELYNGLPF